MARVALDLENKDDLKVLQAEGWRIAPGLVPGEPNQGLVAERRGSPARLADFDDSGWALGDIQERRSIGVIDRTIGAVTGNNTPKRVPVHASAVPGEEHVIAVLVANAPLGDPVGAIFFRYATLAFEAAAG